MGQSTGPQQVDFAFPLGNISRVPLKGEHVLLVKGPSFLMNQGTIDSDVFYYIDVVNMHGNKHLNPMPDSKAGEIEGDNPDYAANSGPVVNDNEPYEPGENFKEVDTVKNHQLFEGDLMIEGRHGHSIRFSQGIEGDTDQYDNQAYWEGKSGSPIISISNGTPPQGGANKFVIENPDETGSSILLTSKDLKLSKYTLSQGVGSAKPIADYNSPQVAINADRLVFNSKIDEIILTGAKDVIVATPTWAAEMDKIFTVLDELVNAVDRICSGQSQFPTPAGGPTLVNPETSKLKQLVSDLSALKQ